MKIKNNTLIAALKSDGYRIVSHKHSRFTDSGNQLIPISRKEGMPDNVCTLQARGGCTLVVLGNAGARGLDVPFQSEGGSICSLLDNFCYSVGTRIAICRALRNRFECLRERFVQEAVLPKPKASVHLFYCGNPETAGTYVDEDGTIMDKPTPVLIKFPGTIGGIVCPSNSAARKACKHHGWDVVHDEPLHFALDELGVTQDRVSNQVTA